jgi:hypothetical protein
MKTVSWILSLYPRRWRERYQEEMMALLEEYTITLKTIFDLFLGALDARLDPSYRTTEGFMFQRFHDVRFLSYIYVSALAIFLVAINCWTLTTNSLYYSFGASSTFSHDARTVALITGVNVVSIICFLTLLGSAVSALRDAFKSKNFGIVLFALLCLGLSTVVSVSRGTEAKGIAEWIVSGIMVLTASVSFFVAGIKGLKMLRNRQISPVLFAILIGLIVPSMLFLYELAGYASTWQDIAMSFGQFIPYISISALLLKLADVSFSRQNWRWIRGLGIFLALLLVAETVVVVVWDVSCLLSSNGSIIIYGPSQGILTLFGDQGSIMMIANTLILIAMLAFVITTLVRAFIIHPNRREAISQPLPA